MSLATAFTRLIWRDRSDEERIERETAAKRHASDLALQSKMVEDAHRYAQRIVDALTRRGLCYRYKKSEKDVFDTIQEIQFLKPYVIKPQTKTIKIRVDTQRLPRGIGIEQLYDENIIELLSSVCEHRIVPYRTPATGLWYIVEDEGLGGIPRHVAFEEIIQQRPPSLADDSLAFPLGIGDTLKPVWKVVHKTQNMMLVGSPRAGKSNGLNNLLCSLLVNNKPNQIQFMMIDLKGGMELGPYADLLDYFFLIPPFRQVKKKKKGEEDPEPMLDDDGQEELPPDEVPTLEPDWRNKERIPALVTKREQVPGALAALIKEVERRAELIASKKWRTWRRYNHHNPHAPLRPIILVIDEWADTRLIPKIGALCEDRITNITNRSLATGIYVWLATQTPDKTVISQRIVNAFESKLVYKCASQYVSQTLLNNYRAQSLSPAGRFIFFDGDRQTEIQTPYMPDELVMKIIGDVGAGKVKEVLIPRKHDVNDIEILRLAIAENDGNLDSRWIFANFGHRKFSNHEAKTFWKKMSNKLLEVDGTFYRVEPPQSAPTPRAARMFPVSDNTGVVVEAPLLIAPPSSDAVTSGALSLSTPNPVSLPISENPANSDSNADTRSDIA